MTAPHFVTAQSTLMTDDQTLYKPAVYAALSGNVLVFEYHALINA